jgi:hypothetical protein
MGRAIREVRHLCCPELTLVLIALLDRLYYQYDIKYLAFCTNPIHALLHVADNIRWLGPPSQYWCFSIERFGAWVKTQAISNRKKPIQFLNNRLRRGASGSSGDMSNIRKGTLTAILHSDTSVDRDARETRRGHQMAELRQLSRRQVDGGFNVGIR